MKELTCGIIIYIEPADKFLIGHSTGNKHFDIPKGIISEQESEIDCAIRETQEEFGLCFNKEDLFDLGVFKFNKKKDISLFYTKIESIDINKLCCTSIEENFLNRPPFPEIDYYELVSEEEFMNKTSMSLRRVLENNKILSIIKNQS